MKKRDWIPMLAIFLIALIVSPGFSAETGKGKEKKESLKSKTAKTFEKARKNVKNAADEVAEKADQGVKNLKERLNK